MEHVNKNPFCVKFLRLSLLLFTTILLSSCALIEEVVNDLVTELCESTTITVTTDEEFEPGTSDTDPVKICFPDNVCTLYSALETANLCSFNGRSNSIVLASDSTYTLSKNYNSPLSSLPPSSEDAFLQIVERTDSRPDPVNITITTDRDAPAVIRRGSSGSLDQRMIYVPENATLTMNNIQLSGAGRRGGGMLVDGKVILNNVTFSEHNAEDGSALNINRGGITATNIKLDGNGGGPAIRFGVIALCSEFPCLPDPDSIVGLNAQLNSDSRIFVDAGQEEGIFRDISITGSDDYPAVIENNERSGFVSNTQAAQTSQILGEELTFRDNTDVEFTHNSGLGGSFMTLNNSTITGTTNDVIFDALPTFGEGHMRLANLTIDGNNYVEFRVGETDGGSLSEIASAYLTVTNNGCTVGFQGNYGNFSFEDFNSIYYGNNTRQDCLSGFDPSEAPRFLLENDEEDPLLNPLADNGGSTFTRSPQANSPVIDIIATDDCLSRRLSLQTDQRGEPRPSPSSSNSMCDRGAVEIQ